MQVASYYDKNSSAGHLPAAHSFSKSSTASLAAAFPSVATSFSGSMPAAQANFNALQKKGDGSSQPAQLYGGGVMLYYLVQAAINNPVLAGGTLALGGLVLWLSQRSGGKKTKPPSEALTRTATVLGFDPQEISDYLNQEEGAISQEEAEKFLDEFFVNRETKYETSDLQKHGIVPSKLIDGLEGSDAQKMNTLFERFNNYEFNYSGSSISALEGYLKRTGDCRTLVNMLLVAAKAAGIEDAEMVSDGRQVLVTKRPIHGRGTEGNVYKKFCWYFDEHHWVSQGGQVYDALFMTKQPLQSRYYVETKTHRKINYMIFEGGWCMIKDDQVHKVDTPIEEGEMGIVVTGGEEKMRMYIDNHYV